MHETTATSRDGFGNECVQFVVNRFINRFNLSKRETEAAIHLAHGLRAKEIAQRMSCSEKMVYAHLARVCKKAGRRDQHELICALLAFACSLRAPLAEPALGDSDPRFQRAVPAAPGPPPTGQ